jgi:hypothetical protein
MGKLAMATVLVALAQGSGCANHCEILTRGCSDEKCSAVWQCGDERREVQVTTEEVTCIAGRRAHPGTHDGDICPTMREGSVRSVESGDAAFDELDEAVNRACNWDIRTVDPIVIGSCGP